MLEQTALGLGSQNEVGSSRDISVHRNDSKEQLQIEPIELYEEN